MTPSSVHETRVLGYVNGFAGEFADGYVAETRNGYFYRRRQSLIAEQLAAIPSTRVLDVGCGSGEYAELCSDLGHDYWGLDISEPMIAAARRSHPRIDPDHFVVGRAQDLSSVPDSFGIVLELGVLEYLDDPGVEAALTEVDKSLEADGFLFLSLLNRRSPFWAAWAAHRALKTAFSRFRRSSSTEPPEQLYSKQQAKRLVRSIGFTTTKVVPFGMALVPQRVFSLAPRRFSAIAARFEPRGDTAFGQMALANLIVARKKAS